MKKHKAAPNQYTAFLSRVDAKGFDSEKCWPWLGAGKGNGYGMASFKGKQTSAHRVSYELFIGPVPKGIDVCHLCDNRWCVNPDHLWLGTRAENMSDCKLKGRGDGGCRKHLTEKQVQEVRKRINAGIKPRRIAQLMNINYETVQSIAKGKSYVRKS